MVAGCADPVHDERVHALGGEQPGIPPGPLHRPGQPCNDCHDGRGPGNVVFSFAGTVYRTADATTPLVGARVRFQDSSAQKYETATNCSGNFFVLVEDFRPEWPVWVKVEYGGLEQMMGSPTYREGSCARCHRDPPGPSSVGHVYFGPSEFPFPPPSCP